MPSCRQGHRTDNSDSILPLGGVFSGGGLSSWLLTVLSYYFLYFPVTFGHYLHGVQLPAKKIILAYRSDGSGTTFIFTDYLSKVSENWKNTYGAGKTVDFPVGQAAKGNPGVAGIIAQTPYSLGYIGSEYAFAQKIPYASVYNKRGELVVPSTESISAAAGDIPQDTRCSITDADAAGAYPISCFTWLLIYKEQHYADRSMEQAKATLDLMQYMLSDSVQQTTATVHYAPLPKKAIEQSLQNLKAVTYDGQPILK